MQFAFIRLSRSGPLTFVRAAVTNSEKSALVLKASVNNRAGQLETTRLTSISEKQTLLSKDESQILEGLLKFREVL